jgi:hypothetical protein
VVNMIILDKIAADTAQRITGLEGIVIKDNKIVSAKGIDKLATDALGVLQEQGVYACFLYLFSKSGSETELNKFETEEMVACGIVSHLVNLFNKPEIALFELEYKKELKPSLINQEKNEVLNYVSEKIAVDLSRLLLVKSLFEQTLIYTRYGAKAHNKKI